MYISFTLIIFLDPVRFLEDYFSFCKWQVCYWEAAVKLVSAHGVRDPIANQLLCHSYLIGHQRPSDSTWGNSLDYLDFISVTGRWTPTLHLSFPGHSYLSYLVFFGSMGQVGLLG